MQPILKSTKGEGSSAKFNEVFHWGYVVPDMEKAVAKWTAQGSRIVVPPAVDPIQNVCCSFLIYADCVPIELIAPMPDGPTPLSSRLSKGGGLDHVCLFTDDLEADVGRFRAEGAVVVVDPCYGSVFNRNLAFLLPRTGLLVELMTRNPVNSSYDPLGDFLALMGQRRQSQS